MQTTQLPQQLPEKTAFKPRRSGANGHNVPVDLFAKANNFEFQVLPRQNNAAGFSLIELMIALTVLSILAGFALPSFANLTQGAKVSSTRNGLFSLMQLARGEALARRTHVVVCASSDGAQCDGVWNGGALVFIDNNRDRSLQSGETTLARFTAAEMRDTTVLGSRRLTSFGPDGRSPGSNQTLSVCAPGRTEGLTVVVSNAGRVRMGKLSCM
jgi:type IV fimbrial biogenesis protein FimT